MPLHTDVLHIHREQNVQIDCITITSDYSVFGPLESSCCFL